MKAEEEAGRGRGSREEYGRKKEGRRRSVPQGRMSICNDQKKEAEAGGEVGGVGRVTWISNQHASHTHLVTAALPLRACRSRTRATSRARASACCCWAPQSPGSSSTHRGSTNQVVRLVLLVTLVCEGGRKEEEGRRKAAAGTMHTARLSITQLLPSACACAGGNISKRCIAIAWRKP